MLIVRACAIGDFVLNLPALQALCRVRRDVRFTLVGHPGTLRLAANFVPVDAVHSIEMEPWSKLFYRPIGGLSFESAVVWMKDPVIAENLRASGVPHVLRADPFPEHGHAATHLLRTLGLGEPPLPDLWEEQSPDVIIHASSGSPMKNWPHFEQLQSRLGEACLSLLEGPLEQTRSGFTATQRQIANLSLSEVSQRLRICRAYVGNDSGITHLASYLGVPTVALFGPTDPRTWGPIGRRTRIIWKRRLEDISVNEVVQTLQWLT